MRCANDTYSSVVNKKRKKVYKRCIVTIFSSFRSVLYKQKMSAKIGKPAPDFKAIAVIDGNFRDVSLRDYKGRYLVLFFYPLDFTFVCPTGNKKYFWIN